MFNLAHTPHYSAQDQLVWKVLFDRQTALLHRRATPAFQPGLARLGLRREAIPDVAALSAEVLALTGWQLVPGHQQLGLRAFFGLLAERRFPVVTRLRTMAEFDFSPTPDLFHDLFGHVPLLLNAELADFLQALGQAAQAAPSPGFWRQLWALYFFTVEFGLVQELGQPRLYGAGLLSSAGELHHCVGEHTPRLPFDLPTVLRTPVSETRFQAQYFVLPAWDELAASIHQLPALMSEAWRQAA